MTKIQSEQIINIQLSQQQPSTVVGTNIVVPVGQTSFPEDYSFTTNNTNVNTNPQKRNINQLYDSFKSFCINNGLDFEKVKTSDLITAISGKTKDELLNVEESEIHKILEKLQNAVNAIKEDIKAIREGKETLSIDLIINYNKLLNGEVPKGWDSVDSFRKAQRTSSESLSERLNRMYKCDVKTLSTEKLAKKLEAYFDYYFQDLKKNGYSKEKVDNLQFTDFTKLLFNSAPEEYSKFLDAIDYLVTSNRDKGIGAIFDSFRTDAEKIKCANEITYEQAQAWNTKADQRGEVPSEQQALLITAAIIKWKDEEHIAEYHEKATTDAVEFYTEENNAKLAKITDENIQPIKEKLAKIEEIQFIKTKIEKGEEITPEEQALVNTKIELTEEEKEILDLYTKDKHFKGNNAGQFVGIAANTVIEESSKLELLDIVNTDTYKISEKAGENFYREVLSQVDEYIKSNPDSLNMTKEDFIKLMDKVTDGNFSTIINDKAKGTTTELAVPTTSQDNKTNTKNNGSNPVSNTSETNSDNNEFGYYLTKLVQQNDPEDLKNSLYTRSWATGSTNKKEHASTLTEAAKGNVEDIKEYVEKSNDGFLDFILKVLNLKYKSKAVETWVLSKLETFNDKILADLCNSITNNKIKMEVGKQISSLAALKEVDCKNSAVEKHFEDLIQEKEELLA